MRMPSSTGATKSLVDSHDGRETLCKDQLRALTDLLRIEGSTIGVSHRERQGGLSNEVHFEAKIGGMACCRLAALFGSNPGNDNTANAMLDEPVLQVRAGQRAVHGLVDDCGRCASDLGQRSDQA